MRILRLTGGFFFIVFIVFLSFRLIEGRNITGKSFSTEEKEKPSFWFYAERAYPLGYIPEKAVKRARKQAETLRKSTKDTFSWRSEGPYNIGGRITAIAVNPLNPAVFYIGTADGGVFKTQDSGRTFEHVFNNALTLSIGALAIDPNDTATLYVGTGETNASGDSFDGNGVYVSHNSGMSFEYLGLENCGRIGDIVVHPESSNIVYVACMGYLFEPNPDRGVFMTRDNGQTWEKVLYLDDTTGCIDIEINPVHPDTLFCAMWHRVRTPMERIVGGASSGIYRSTDGGSTWQRLTYNLPQGDTVGRIGIAISKSNPSVIYAVYADDPGYFVGVFKSTDGGNTWFDLPTDDISDIFSSYGWYFGRIYVDPQDENHIYVLGLYVASTSDNGNTWQYIASINDYVHVDHHAFYINPQNPDYILDGNDGGLYRTQDGGSSWYHFENLSVTQFYDICLDPQNPDRLYGGTQDNGTIRRKNYGTDNWERIYYGDGFHVAVDPRDYRVIYAEYQWVGLGKSTDDGYSWQDATDGIDSNDRTNWDTPYVLDPINPDIMYLGTYRVYKSYNGAQNWTPKSPDLTNGKGKLVYGTITVIHVNKQDNRFVYVGTDDGNVWYSPDSGNTWIKISDSLPARYVTDIITLDSDPGVIFVTLSGYALNEHTPYIFESQDTGRTWQDITYNLPQAPCNRAVLDKYNRIFVATDVGVYVKTIDDTIWYAYGQNLPISVVMDLKIDNSNDILYAATHGLGIYSVSISPSSIGEENDKSDVVFLRNSMVSDRISIVFGKHVSGEIKIDLYNMAGLKVATLYKGRVTENNMNLHIPQLPEGMYLMSIKSKNFRKTFKLFVKGR